MLCYRPLMFGLKDHYNILCLGLSGSGKSTLLANLVGENTSHIEPTNGFNIKTMPIKNSIVCIKEIGGSAEMQRFWDHYFNDTNALLYMVNASCDDEQLKTAKRTLKSLLSNSKFKNKPCIILGTHSDLPNSRTENQLEQYFQNIMHGYKWKVQCCSSFEQNVVMEILEALLDMMTINKT